MEHATKAVWYCCVPSTGEKSHRSNEFRVPTTTKNRGWVLWRRRILNVAHGISTSESTNFELKPPCLLSPAVPPLPSSSTSRGFGRFAPAFRARRSSSSSWRFITHQREDGSSSAPAGGTARKGEVEAGGNRTPMMPSFDRRAGEKEGRMKERARAELTQTRAPGSDHDDHRKETKPTFVAKHRATGMPTTSTATATPATVATLVTAAGSRHAVPFERKHRHVDGSRELDERHVLLRNTNVVASRTTAAGTTSSISHQRTTPEVAAVPKSWTFMNTMGVKTAAADASKKSNSVRNDPGMVRRSAKRETLSTSGICPAGRGGGGGIEQRWNRLDSKMKALKAFRRGPKSAAAATTSRLPAGKRNWAGLKALHDSTLIFMHALNVGSGYPDEDASSSSSEDGGEEHGDIRFRWRGRQGAGEGVGARESGSENSSSIWRESSGSDCNSSSDNNTFDEEVGGWVACE